MTKAIRTSKTIAVEHIRIASEHPFADVRAALQFFMEADALKGVSLYVAKSKLPSLPDDEFYHADLIGLDAFDTGGKLLGRVQAVHNHGAGDLLEITGPGLKTALLLPFTLLAVPTVDLSAGRIIVDPPEGLD